MCLILTQTLMCPILTQTLVFSILTQTLMCPILTQTLMFPILTQTLMCLILTQTLMCPILTETEVFPILTQTLMCPILTQILMCPILTQILMFPILISNFNVSHTFYWNSRILNYTEVPSLNRRYGQTDKYGENNRCSFARMLLANAPKIVRMKQGQFLFLKRTSLTVLHVTRGLRNKQTRTEMSVSPIKTQWKCTNSDT